MRAACDDAAGGLAAVRAACTTDRATLGRVAAILRDHIGGTAPVLEGYEPPSQALPLYERRTRTPLVHVRGLR